VLRERNGEDYRTTDMADERPTTSQEDWAEHQRTYHGFVKGVVLFAAHVLVILLILAWVFADSFNVPPVTS
jgi:Bacterial aa3 type cytochrome c oxidase subunit IV